MFEKDKNQGAEINFTELQKLFPASFDATRLPLLVVAAVAATISVVTNYEFGGKFATEFFEKMGIKDKTSLEKLRDYFAVASAVVNGYINARSVEGATVKIYNKGKEVIMGEADFKSLLGILGLISLAGVGALPNLQYVKDTVADWSKAKELTLEIVVPLVMGALNFRALNNFADAANAKLFGKKNHEDAQNIRRSLLTQLNEIANNVKDERFTGLSNEDIDLLAEGTLHKDKLPAFFRTGARWTAAAVPSFYALAVSFFPTKKAMEAFTEVDNYEDKPAFYYMAETAAYAIAVITVVTKELLLGRISANLTDRFFDAWLADEILPNLKDNQTDATTVLKMLLKVINEAVQLGVAVSSLSGAMGTIQEYLFKESDELGTYIGSITIAIVSALNINFADFKDINAGVAGVMQDLWKKLQGIEASRTHRYGADMLEFVVRAMQRIASMTDAEILSKFTTKTDQNMVIMEEADEEKGLLNDDSNEKPQLHQGRTLSAAYNNLLAEVMQLASAQDQQQVNLDSAYDAFRKGGAVVMQNQGDVENGGGIGIQKQPETDETREETQTSDYGLPGDYSEREHLSDKKLENLGQQPKKDLQIHTETTTVAEEEAQDAEEEDQGYVGRWFRSCFQGF